MFNDFHGFEHLIAVRDSKGMFESILPLQSIQQDVLQSMIDSQQAQQEQKQPVAQLQDEEKKV